MNSLLVRDPHLVFTCPGESNCDDITYTPVGGDPVTSCPDGSSTVPVPSFETFMELAIGSTFDINMLVRFDDLNTDAGSIGSFTVSDADCVSATDCGPDTDSAEVDDRVGTYTVVNGTCLEANFGDTAWSPAPVAVGAVCLRSDIMPVLELDLGDNAVLRLHDARLAATLDTQADPQTLSPGLIRGFVTEADADALDVNPLTDDVILLSSLLPGGSNNCVDGGTDTMDTHPTLGDGWWIYSNFTADQTTYTE